MKKLLKQRFLEKIKKTSACWIWNSACNNKGYGFFSFKGGTVLAHRFSFEMFKGKITRRDLVLHKCDNPICVNPKHLFLGSQSDNMKDCRSKKRGVDNSGEKSGRCKLTNDVVKTIRNLYKNGGYSHRKLGFIYGVSGRNIGKIVNGKSWKLVS